MQSAFAREIAKRDVIKVSKKVSFTHFCTFCELRTHMSTNDTRTQAACGRATIDDRTIELAHHHDRSGISMRGAAGPRRRYHTTSDAGVMAHIPCAPFMREIIPGPPFANREK